MGSLLERNQGIERRANNLQPIAEDVRQILISGKRDQLTGSRDITGQAFAPLAPSTLKYRTGSGPPLLPQGEASAFVTGYTVEVSSAPTALHVRAGWPDNPIMGYHVTGTNKMPRRDPSGFRPEDKAKVMARLTEFVMKSD